MPITQSMVSSFKQQLFAGDHNMTADTFKIALYVSTATLDASTTVYTTSGEVAATGGYTTGGNTLSGATISLTGTTAFVSFSNTSWANATITARGALIYNFSKSNKAVAVLDFGSDKVSSGGTFTIQFPTNDATNAILRIA